MAQLDPLLSRLALLLELVLLNPADLSRPIHHDEALGNEVHKFIVDLPVKIGELNLPITVK